MKKNNNLYILLVVAAVFALVLYYSIQSMGVYDQSFSQKSQNMIAKSVTQKNSSKSNQDSTYMVTYTDKGFVPSNIQIPKGKVLKFVNLSKGKLKVYSDQNIDANLVRLSTINENEVSSGSIYTFSFEKSGLWTYYNQFKTSDKGSVTIY